MPQKLRDRVMKLHKPANHDQFCRYEYPAQENVSLWIQHYIILNINFFFTIATFFIYTNFYTFSKHIKDRYIDFIIKTKTCLPFIKIRYLQKYAIMQQKEILGITAIMVNK